MSVRQVVRRTWVLLALGAAAVAAWPTGAGAQSADASLCKLLPVSSIEKLLGAKANEPHGSDLMPNVGNCVVQAPDGKHMVILSTAARPSQGGSIAARTKRDLKMMESSPAPRMKATYQYLGDVVCATEELGPPVKQTTCMTDHGQRQFNFLVRSDNPSHLRPEAVKQLLKETVAKVKETVAKAK
jgi:hypothetical protein